MQSCGSMYLAAEIVSTSRAAHPSTDPHPITSHFDKEQCDSEAMVQDGFEQVNSLGDGIKGRLQVTLSFPHPWLHRPSRS